MEATYKFLSTGELEIPTRAGWRTLGGCSCRGIFEFADRMTELGELLQEADDTDSIEALYLHDKRFAHCCDRVMLLNGIDPDEIRPRDLAWLLFPHQGEDGTIHPSPLQKLNAPPEPRHPRKAQTDDGPGDFIALLAGIAAQCGSIEEAYRTATSQPAREVLGALEDMAWASQSDEDKADLKFRAQADKYRQQFGSPA